MPESSKERSSQGSSRGSNTGANKPQKDLTSSGGDRTKKDMAKKDMAKKGNENTRGGNRGNVGGRNSSSGRGGDR
jgi:hypothetical protein